MTTGRVIALPGTPAPLAHVLSPIEGESLLSFVLRLDQANGFAPGTVARMVAVHSTGWRQASTNRWAAGSEWDLRQLASLSLNPYEAILALTLLPDLRAAATDPDLAITALGAPGILRFCPVCLATDGTMLRWFLLPFIEVCPVHEIRLQPFCRRGHANDQPPAILDGRVACSVCLDDLGPTAGTRPDEETLRLGRDAARAWAFLLGWRGDDIRGRGYRTIRTFHRGYPLRNLGQKPSFAALVTVFLALQIDPRLVAEMEERPVPPCPNATCDRFLAPGPDDPLAAPGAVERHCAECGCRFLGRRMLLCFDAGHGCAGVSPRAARRARRRLLRWRADLDDAIRDDLVAGRRVAVSGTFRRAGIPLNANLRARRLGLVGAIRDAARRQRLLQGREPLATQTVTMAESRFLAEMAHEARWTDVWWPAQAALVHPLRPMPPIHSVDHDDRPDPLHGLLDPLFPPSCVTRQGYSASTLRWRFPPVVRRSPELIASGYGTEWWAYPLTERWESRVQGWAKGECEDAVAPASWYRGVGLSAMSPMGRERLLSEWGPDWLAEAFSASIR